MIQLTNGRIHDARFFFCASAQQQVQQRKDYDAGRNFRLVVQESGHFPGIYSGSVVVANAGLEPRHGDLVIVLNDDEFEMVAFTQCLCPSCTASRPATSDRRKVFGVVVSIDNTKTPFSAMREG